MSDTIVVETEPTVNSETGEFNAPDIECHDSTCNICQEELINNKIKTPCNHLFCGSCFFKWMQEKPNCPLCRKEFVNEDIMKNISENREELSVLTSELEYTKYQAISVKRRLCKRKRTCTELLKRQISLKQMLDKTKQCIIAERKKLKSLRRRRVRNPISEASKFYKEDIDFINELVSTAHWFNNDDDSTDTEDINIPNDFPYIPMARSSLDETVWNNQLLQNNQPNIVNEVTHTPEYSPFDNNENSRSPTPIPSLDLVNQLNESTEPNESPPPLPLSNEETVSPTPTQTNTPEYSHFDSETNSSPSPDSLAAFLSSLPPTTPEPTESPPEIPATEIEQNVINTVVPPSQEFNSPFEFGMEPINFEELFPANRDNSGNVIFEFGQSN